MIEEILINLYKIEIPLPESPLKSLNSYIIKSQDRNLIIDTGMNREECLNVMMSGLKELAVDIRKTDCYITHLHSDHLGLVSRLASDSSTIYFNQPGAGRIKAGIFLDDLIGFARLNGFPEDELQTISYTHPGFKYRPKENLDFYVLREDDTIRVSDYVFNCVETPGHTKGHMCLYEPSKKILVAGDHILSDITPNILLMSDEWDPLKAYLESLGKVSGLDIELVLPGHRGTFTNCRERIQELKHHHQERLDEIILILKKGSVNAFQIASQMTWDILYDSWELFPVPQKWFATGEAVAHLKYLEGTGMIKKEMPEKNIIYSLN